MEDSKKDFDSRFNAILGELLEQPVDEVLLTTNIEEAGINSLAFVKLIVDLEREFDFEFEDDAFLVSENFTTILEFKETIKKYIEEYGELDEQTNDKLDEESEKKADEQTVKDMF